MTRFESHHTVFGVQTCQLMTDTMREAIVKMIQEECSPHEHHWWNKQEKIESDWFIGLLTQATQSFSAFFIEKEQFLVLRTLRMTM